MQAHFKDKVLKLFEKRKRVMTFNEIFESLFPRVSVEEKFKARKSLQNCLHKCLVTKRLVLYKRDRARSVYGTKDMFYYKKLRTVNSDIGDFKPLKEIKF